MKCPYKSHRDRPEVEFPIVERAADDAVRQMRSLLRQILQDEEDSTQTWGGQGVEGAMTPVTWEEGDANDARTLSDSARHFFAEQEVECMATTWRNRQVQAIVGKVIIQWKRL